MMGKKVKQWAMLAVVLALAGACAHAEMGRKFDTAAASKIEIGKTTEAEVIALLGEPLNKMILRDGRRVYSYNYIKSEARAGLFGPQASGQGDQLMLGFDKTGIVRSMMKGSSPVGMGPGTLD